MTQRTLFAAAAVVLAVWLVNEQTLDYGFVYDDRAVIVERQPVWATGWSEFVSTRTLGVGRHVTLVSLDLDRREPLSPRAFHVTNTSIAAVNALLVLALAASIGLPPFAALAAALLFAVHPTHVDAVVSIVGRSELLAAFGVLAALVLHTRGYSGRRSFVALAALCFFFALSSKESAACLPLLLLLAELFGLGRRNVSVLRPRLWPLAYVVAGVAWLALVIGNFGTTDPIPYVDNPLAHVSFAERITRAGELLWRYAAWSLWPFGLKPDRGFAEIGAAPVFGPLAWIAWSALAIGALALRRRAPLLGFALLWLPAAFAVTGNVAVPIGTLMAERLLYLPSVGPCLLFGLLVGSLWERSRLLKIAGATSVSLSVLLLALGYESRSRVWIDDDHYHSQAAALSPRSAKAHYNLASSLARRERYEEAELSFGRAIALLPNFAAATHYRAEALTRLGRREEAAAAYEAYLRVVPDDVDALRFAAASEAAIGRFDAALERQRRAVELAPDRTELRLELVDLETRARSAAQSLNASSSAGSR
jgi:tetratricopeptide (TPR) repeat protein